MVLRLWMLFLLVCVSAFAPARADARAAETRTWVFLPEVTETRLETEPQFASTHQENGLFHYEHAPGCSQAAENAAGTGYRSFSEFKRAEGVAGQGQAWHHVVEQTPGNVRRFGAEAIHNTENLVKLPYGPGTIHNQISGFYSSKQPFTNGLTVRQWLSPQTFQEQVAFGRNAIQQFGGSP